MPSQLQIEANRRNSQKSTGPRTAAGKVISSHNALGSGIYAESETIRDENASDLEALAASYFGRFHPGVPEQRAFVDVLVHSEWTLRRLRRAEAQLWEQNMEWSEPCSAENLFSLGRAVSYEGSKVFTRLQHRVTATQRNFERSLKDLQRLQADRPSAQPPAQPQPLPTSHPAPPKLASFRHPSPCHPPAPNFPPPPRSPRPPRPPLPP